MSNFSLSRRCFGLIFIHLGFRVVFIDRKKGPFGAFFSNEQNERIHKTYFGNDIPYYIWYNLNSFYIMRIIGDNNMANIHKEIEELQNSSKKIKNIPEERLLPLLAYKYIYLTSPEDIRVSDFKRITVDGPNDGGIDAIFAHPEEPRLVIIQSKYYSKPISNKDIVIDAFRKLAKTINDLKNNQTASYREDLRKVWANEYDPTLQMEVVFLTSTDITDTLKNKILDILKQEDFSFTPLIYTKKDLELFIDNSGELSPWVEHDKLIIDKNNLCRCPNNENGIIVNITAKSLKQLYEKYTFRLFQQNFRYYVKDKKVDSKVIDSIRKDQNNFWFLNNGIIIACEDFLIDGDNLKLTNFSIINGCQTTSLLGNNDIINDFFLTCKVVKPHAGQGQDQFVAKIAEASNRQKAIRSRDLKSTEKSMRKLQKDLAEEPNPFFMEIRRGEKTPKNAIKIKNELYGQLVLSFIFQQPAKARNSKNTMFESDDLYNMIFRRKNFDKQTIEDIYSLYTAFNNYRDKKENFAPIESETMINYIHFYVLAIAGLLVKIKRNVLEPKNWKNKLESDAISGHFLNIDLDKYEIYLQGFFDYLLKQLTDIFNDHKIEIGTEANFTKVQGYYHQYIIPVIMDKFVYSDYEKLSTGNFLKLFK